jgi:phage shock protein PspC (stress-responsive transcriptional regulator)
VVVPRSRCATLAAYWRVFGSARVFAVCVDAVCVAVLLVVLYIIIIIMLPNQAIASTPSAPVVVLYKPQ